MSPVLEARKLTAGYGAVPVVHELNLTVEAGEVVALLGANGAGKTTTMLTLAGELPASSGEIHLHGKLTKAPLNVRARQHLSFVPEMRGEASGVSRFPHGALVASSAATATMLPKLGRGQVSCGGQSTAPLRGVPEMPPMWAAKGLSMEKWMCWGSLAVAGLMLLLFGLDLATGMPFGGSSLSGMRIVDILGLLMSALLLYMSWDALRGVG
ncbi:MAG: ATP-binding cassette domain-containing protein [Actinobacteria bacterium]|nr:ATP-binding cassette domain-containing protein [Actinomycetota bacterium]